MRRSEDFRATVRRGVKTARPTLVTHVLLPAGPNPGGRAASVGFVVSRAVGSAVDRNRAKRRLRHLMRVRLSHLPSGSHVVVRALPAARTASFATLGADLDESLRRAGAR